MSCNKRNSKWSNRNKEYPCTQCSKIFRHNGQRNGHINDVHGNAFQCRHCNGSLTRRASLWQHLKDCPSKMQRQSVNTNNKREHQGKPKTERKSMALTATAAEIKKDEPDEDKAFNAYVEAQKPSLYQDYVAKRHEERGERQRQLKELARQSSECPITLDSESDDDAQTVQDQYEPMEVANTATTRFRVPKLKKSETTATVVTTSPLSSGKPEASLSLKSQLQLAEQRLAGKNVAITAQAHQLDTLDRKPQALQLELSSEKTKYHMLKTEADDAILKERQVSSQLRRENEYLQQQLKDHDQLALDNAHTNRAYQLLQAQHEALLAENRKLEARVVRIPKKKAKVPDPLLIDAVGGGEETDTGMADLLFAVNPTNN